MRAYGVDVKKGRFQVRVAGFGGYRLVSSHSYYSEALNALREVAKDKNTLNLELLYIYDTSFKVITKKGV